MIRKIKLALLVFIALMTIALTYMVLRHPHASTRAEGGVRPHDPGSATGPLDALGVRYDGYYRNSRGSLLYLVRFFPEGRAVLANGSKDVEAQLVALLKRDAVGDPDIGHYNVPVTLKGDSLFFKTTPRRGTIDYSGVLSDGDSLVLLRISHITGSKELKSYVFKADGSPFEEYVPEVVQP